MDDQQALSYCVSTAYSDSGYLSEPAFARERPHAHSGTRNELKSMQARSPKRSRNYINATADRLTEHLVETADAITASQRSNTRPSLGARTTVISVGPHRLSDAARTRRDPLRMAATKHDPLTSPPPAKRARQRSLPVRDRLLYGHDDQEGTDPQDEDKGRHLQLVQVPSPRSGKPRTVVYKPPPPVSSVATGVGMIELPSFMRSSEAAARPSDSLSPPPRWIASTFAAQEPRAPMSRVAESEVDLELLSPPSEYLPYASSRILSSEEEFDPLTNSWPVYDAPPCGPMPSTPAIGSRNAPSSLPFSAPGHPASPVLGHAMRFSPVPSATPIYEQQLAREAQALQTPVAADFPPLLKSRSPSLLLPCDAYLGPVSFSEDHVCSRALDGAKWSPPLDFEQPFLSARAISQPPCGPGLAATETPLQIKHSLAKARRAAHLEQAAAELISTTKPSLPMLAEPTVFEEAEPFESTLIRWSAEPDAAPMSSPSPPQRFPTPSSYSSRAATPVQSLADPQSRDCPTENHPSTPRAGVSATGPDNEQPSQCPSAQDGAGGPMTEEPGDMRSDDCEAFKASGTDRLAQHADFAIYEDPEPER